MNVDDTYFTASRMLRRATVIFLEWLNHERGGLVVNGSRLSMRFTWIDDSSSAEQVPNATAFVLREQAADFAFGPYTSDLTQWATQQSALDGKLLLATTAATPSVYQHNNLTFGTLPPTTEYMRASIGAVAAAATECDASSSCIDQCRRSFERTGASSCVGAIRVGMIQEDALFTGSVCSSAESQAIALGLDVARDASGVALIVTVPSSSNATEYDRSVEAALQVLYDANVRSSPVAHRARTSASAPPPAAHARARLCTPPPPAAATHRRHPPPPRGPD